MGQPYIGEIRMMANNYVPPGWQQCDGSLLPIAEQEALFQLIGTTYGGDGESTFAVPNLQGRVPMGTGGGEALADAGGTESVTLTTQQMPLHTHPMLGSTAQATSNSISNNVAATLLAAGDLSAYGTQQPYRAVNPNAITQAGGNQPHNNVQPYQTLNILIALFGIFPSPT